MIDREQLAEHLKFFAELGVDGISRDPAWRARPAEFHPVAARTGAGTAAPPAAEAATGKPQAESAAAEPAVTGRPRPAGAATGKPAPPPAGAATWETAPPVAGAAAWEPPPPAAGAAAGETAPAAAATGKPAPPVAGDDVPEAIPAWTTDSLWDAPAPPAGPANVPPAERLQGIRDELGDCTRCKLHGGRTNLVFGVGNPGADLMFVGEAPGRDEDLQGEPFVGRAGQLLTRIIEAIDLRREDVYIANVVKCRPPQNRNPERDEVETCRPFLLAQIDAVRPRVVVALGTFAIRTLLDDDRLSISRARGRVYKCRGARLVPTFHPAFLLRSPDRKRDVWEDMKRVRSILRGG